jgi:GNAT superfamily N-acetyltransferase
MLDSSFVYFTCSQADLLAIDTHGVRWLDQDHDYELARNYWAAFNQNLRMSTWHKAHEYCYEYAANLENNWITATAAVWRFSETTWDVAAVSTLPDYRRQGRSRATIAFVTAHILEAGRVASCCTNANNQAAVAAILSVGFHPIEVDQVWWTYPKLPDF